MLRAPLLGLFSFCLFVLSCSNVLGIILPYCIVFYYYPLEVCFFSNERQKGQQIQMGREEGLGGVSGSIMGGGKAIFNESKK